MKKYFIKTFGCQMNQADSEKINMILLQSWFIKINNIPWADLVILNTCSVRKKWEDKVFSMVNSIIKERRKWNNNTIVWITWCMVRKTWLNKDFLEEGIFRKKSKKIDYISDKKWIFNNDDWLFPVIDGLDFTLRIEEIKYLPFILSHILWEKIWNDDKFDDYLKSKQIRDNPYSASVIIQTWCDNFCSFCIVPYTRGREISRPKNEIVNEVKQAVLSWAKEVTLIWQNVNSYWKQFAHKKFWNSEKSKWEGNLKSPFRDLLEELDCVEWLDRIRFTSSNPHDMTKDILDSHFDLKTSCNHLHFALQSWSDEMLKKMNRKHTYSDFKKQVDYLRSKDPFFSIFTDIIVWYSWETEEMFNDTVKAFRECEFDFVYNARYSVRNWTIASKIYPDDIPNWVKAKRWHILNDILLENVTKRNSLMLWKIEDILISWANESKFFWRTRNFKEVFFNKKDSVKIWDIVKVKINKLDKWVLKWEIVW